MIALVLAGALLAQDAERLRRAADQAEAELKAFRARAAEEEKAQEKVLDEVRRATRAAASDILDLEEKTRALRAELDAQDVERRRLGAERERLGEIEKRLTDAADAMRRELAEVLGALPPFPKLAAPPAGAGEEDLARGLLSAVREGSVVRRFTREIVGPDGRPRAVEILRVGHVFAAYRDPSGHVGLAVRAPEGEGYRWIEELPSELSDGLEAAFQGRAAAVPVDIGQAITAETRMAGPDLWAFLRAGGPVMVPLAAVALLALGLALERWVFLVSQARHRPSIVEAILGECRQGRFAEARSRAEAMGGPVGRVLAAALAARGRSAEAMAQAVQAAMMQEAPRLERGLAFLGILAGVAPMLGLLGTVTGMISTFDMIVAFGNGDPGLMAGGISEALITTVAGLVIAIPALLVYSHLTSRVDRLTSDVDRHVASLANILAEEPAKEAHGAAL